MSDPSAAMFHKTTSGGVQESELITSGRDTTYSVQNNYNIGVFHDVIGFFQIAAQLFVALIRVNQSTGDGKEPDEVEISSIMPPDPSSLPPVSSIADRYTRSMLECMVGYPLYEPRPFSQLSKEYSHHGVNIGDVGFVRKDGTFDFLFNICPPKNSLINPPNLPNGFSLEKPEQSETRNLSPVPCETRFFPRTVEETASGEYICRGPEGAILVLPDGGIQDEAIDIGWFEDLAKIHGVEWYKYTMSRGRSISNGSLYLVTSYTKCAQWGMAVFDRPCDPGQGLTFVNNPFSWKCLRAFTTKVADPNQEDTPNQCVFLQGYKIMIRQDIFDNLHPRRPAQRIRGGGGTDLLSRILIGGNPFTRTKISGTKKSDEVVLHPNFNSSPIHPSDFINAALLNQNPDAKVALTHDDTWCDLLRNNFPNLNYAELMNIARLYASTIDEYGCILLKKIPGSSNGFDENSRPLRGAEVPALQEHIQEARSERNPDISKQTQTPTTLQLLSDVVDHSHGDGNEDRTPVIADQHNTARADGDTHAQDSDSAVNGESSVQRFHSYSESNRSLPPFTWNVKDGRYSTDFSSLESRFEPTPKLSRRRKLDMSLASIVQAEYYSLSDNLASATTQELTESDIYSRLLLKRRYGYPLYHPEPLKDLPAEYGRKGVRIGDVGRITPDGAFDFLFNVDSAQSSTINPPNLPRDFETVPPIQITTEDYFRQGAQIFSDHVAEIRNKPIITYDCLASEDSILHLPENTTLFQAQDKDELQDLATRHAYSWYEYLAISRFQDIANGSLYLVTDCIKTTNWGIGVFNNNHRPDCDYLEFVSEDQGPRRRYGWRTLGSIVAKVAPTPVDVTNADVNEQNQCLFLLGFKISLGQRLWRNLQYRALNQSPVVGIFPGTSFSYSSGSRFSANTMSSIPGSTFLSHSPTHANGDQQVQETLARLEGQSHSAHLHQIFGATCPVHPSDFISAMLLLHEPDADVAIVHDDEWCDLLPNNFSADPRRLEIKDLLENIAKSRISIINQYGCVSLKKPGVNWDSQNDTPARASSDLLASRSQGEINDSLSQISATFEDRARLSSQEGLDPLVPTTAAAAEQCAKFRILLVGRSGVGKSSLINSIFKTSLAVEYHQARLASIEREITSPYNEYLVVHDSEGYEPGDPRKFEVIEKFITKRCNATNSSEKLHAVWLCIPTPFGNGRVLETGDEQICVLKQLGVPVIIVFTKYDLLLSVARRELISNGSTIRGDELITKTQDSARKKFETRCMPHLMKLAERVPRMIPYIGVSTRYPENLQNLVQITLKNISIPNQHRQTNSFFKQLGEGIIKKKIGIPDDDHTVSPTESYSDPRTLMFVLAQRVDINSKLAASISVGKRKYWSGLASGFHFRNNTIWRCLKVIHTDIINVWNIRGLSQYLLSDEFREKISIIVGELRPDVPGQRWTSPNLAELLAEARNRVVSACPAAVVIAPVATTVALSAWVHEIYKQAPHIIRCFIGYIVDLTIIVQTLFKISAQDPNGKIETARVEEILDNFAASPIKDTVHNEIREFVTGLRSRFENDAIIAKIDSLIHSNKDVQL